MMSETIYELNEMPIFEIGFYLLLLALTNFFVARMALALSAKAFSVPFVWNSLSCADCRSVGCQASRLI